MKRTICVMLIYLIASTAILMGYRSTSISSNNIEIEGEEYNVLIFSDTHINNSKVGDKNGDTDSKTFALMDEMVAQAPETNMIVMLGDNVDLTGKASDGSNNKDAMNKLLDKLDTYGKPYAMIFGNHDGEGDLDNLALYNECIKSRPLSLMQEPMKDVDGVSNYSITLTKNGKAIMALIFFDTHSLIEGTDRYDFIKPSQIKWYSDLTSNMAKENGGVPVPNIVFTHIPLFEYVELYFQYLTNASVMEKDGFWSERPAPSGKNSGLFKKIKEQGGTKMILAGHEHVNYGYIQKDGILMGYVRNATYGNYGSEYKKSKGSTTLKIKSNGEWSYSHLYYDDAKKDTPKN